MGKGKDKKMVDGADLHAITGQVMELIADEVVVPRFAPVVPVGVAGLMRDQGSLGDYHLLLAHDVAAHPKEYSAVYQAYDHQTIIMDNSVIELGHPIEKEIMIDAIRAVYNVTGRLIFVLPDRLLDSEGTLSAVDSALDNWAPAIRNAFPLAEMMVVPQGSDIGDWVRCVELLSRLEEVTWVGIPRNFREKLGGTRIQATQMASILRPDWNIHLLGFSDDLHDDITTCHVAYRMGYKLHGIDSAVPVRAAMRDCRLLQFYDQVHSARGDWWENPGDWDGSASLVQRNMELINRWVSA